ncbi:MAG TPA: biopolymer transporter ExbD [bacterium]|nr:biopolymer transporter ExbD [bacterium]
MSMGSIGGKRRRAIAEINITPMVDIMLVLLIIFMVAAPMIEQGVDLDLPQTETIPIENPKDKFILRVFKNEKIFIEKAEIPIKQLEEKLRTNAKLQEDRELFLYASQRLPYGFVVRVMAIVKKAGISKIYLVTDPLEEG